MSLGRMDRKRICPTSDVMQRVAEDAAEPQELAEVVEHLDLCRECRAQFDHMLESLYDLRGIVDAGRNALQHRTDDDTLSARLTASFPSVLVDDRQALVELGLKPEPPRDPTYLARYGPYDIMRVLGAGATGVVLLAHELALERRVALKLMRPQQRGDSDARRRFLFEARAVARLTHPNIVTIHAVGEEQRMPFIAMEFLKGGSLADLVDDEAPLEPLQAAEICHDILVALAHAHENGIIHRDVKPANVLFPDRGRPAKLADFGLARIVSADALRTQEGVISGTPSYMSPEQVAGEKDLGIRTDLFSVGVVLFELLTGALPFQGKSVWAVMQAIREVPTPDPRELRPSVPTELAEVVYRALEKEPSRRFLTAHEFAQRLHGFLDRAASGPEETTGLPSSPNRVERPAALPIYSCSYCRVSLASALSMGGSCEHCDRGICFDCWSAHGIRTCREHAGRSQTASQGASVARRCPQCNAIQTRGGRYCGVCGHRMVD